MCSLNVSSPCWTCVFIGSCKLCCPDEEWNHRQVCLPFSINIFYCHCYNRVYLGNISYFVLGEIIFKKKLFVLFFKYTIRCYTQTKKFALICNKAVFFFFGRYAFVEVLSKIMSTNYCTLANCSPSVHSANMINYLYKYD